MITSYRVLIWFALQFALGVGAAVGAMISLSAGLGACLAALASALITLHLGWSVRERRNALKPLSDGVALMGLLAFLYLLFTQQLVYGLGALLFSAQLAMNLILREYRQLYFGLMVAFVFILAGAAESVSGSYLLVLLAYGLVTSFCFAEIWLDRKVGRVAGLKPPSSWQRLRVAGLLFVVALAFYLGMPRPPAANFGSQQSSSPDYYISEQWEQEADQPGEPGGDGQGESGQGSVEPGQPEPDRESSGSGEGYDYAGFDRQFDIREPGGSSDRNSNAIVAYMRAPHGNYLKVRSFDVFDGLSWSASSHQYRKQRTDRGRIALVDNLEPNYRQVIQVEQTLSAFVPAAASPVELWLPASVVALDAWEQPLLPGPLVAGTRYTVDSRVERFAGRPLGGRTPPRPADLQLPDDLDPRIPQLARRIALAATGDFDRARLLEQHLRTEYEYSFESIFDSQGVTPLPRFLFDEKRGHCEYFASAMAVMLRSLDIPARLITGFSVTHKNPMTGYYEIRALDGHAWVEAWVPEAGWVTFEPTAFYDMPRPREEALSAEQINDYVESLQRSDEALGEQSWSLSRLLAGLWQMLYTGFVVVIAWLKLALMLLWPLLLVLTVAAVALAITRRHWQPRLQFLLSRWQIRRYQPADSRNALHFYLRHLQRMSASRGVRRKPGEPVESWAETIKAVFREAGAIDDLVPLVNRVFYEQEASVTPEEVREVALAVAGSLR